MPYEPDAYGNPGVGAGGPSSPSTAPIQKPTIDPIVLGMQVWRAIDDEIDARSAGGDHPPRIYGANFPFGSPGTAIAVTGSGLYLAALGVEVPTRLVGWRLWVQPAGSLTIDVRRVQPQATPPVAETSIVGTSGGPGVTGGTYNWSDDLSTWSVNDTQFNRNDLMTVYITASTTVEYGLFRFRFRDLTLNEPVSG